MSFEYSLRSSTESNFSCKLQDYVLIYIFCSSLAIEINICSLFSSPCLPAGNNGQYSLLYSSWINEDECWFHNASLLSILRCMGLKLSLGLKMCDADHFGEIKHVNLANGWKVFLPKKTGFDANYCPLRSQLRLIELLIWLVTNIQMKARLSFFTPYWQANYCFRLVHFSSKLHSLE